MTTYGADSAELERLAGEFRRTADELDAEGGMMTRLLSNVSWLGDVATRFVGSWTGIQLPKIGLSTRFLREAADQLNRNAAEQRQASAVSGSRAPSIAPVDRATVDWNVREIRSALDTGGWGVTASDLQRVRAAFESMTPVERAAVFAELSDEEIRVLKDQMQESRIKGGWSSEEQRDFLQMLLPPLPPDEARRLMGDDWATIRESYDVGAPSDGSDLVAGLIQRTKGDDGLPGIAQDEIEVRALDNGRYVVVLPGVVDLSDGFDAVGDSAAGLGVGALVSPIGALIAAGGTLGSEWEGGNEWGSARDMHYARQSEMNSVNGSVNGTNAYAFAAKQAMLAAGVPDGAEVMIVGHSFGAYTAAELATDPTFNDAIDGEQAGYSVNVTHVAGAGASAAFRMNDLPSGTEGLLLNNANDAAYIGERAIPTNNEVSQREVVFSGGTAGAGHDPSNYVDYVRGAAHPDVAEFSDSAFEMYGGEGSAQRVTVKDAYRVGVEE